MASKRKSSFPISRRIFKYKNIFPQKAVVKLYIILRSHVIIIIAIIFLWGCWCSTFFLFLFGHRPPSLTEVCLLAVDLEPVFLLFHCRRRCRNSKGFAFFVCTSSIDRMVKDPKNSVSSEAWRGRVKKCNFSATHQKLCKSRNQKLLRCNFH